MLIAAKGTECNPGMTADENAEEGSVSFCTSSPRLLCRTVAPMSVSKGAGLDVYPPDVHYYKTESNVEVLLHATAAAACTSMARAVFEASEAAIKAKDSFTLVLSGGSLLTALSSLIALKGAKWSWEKFHIFFVVRICVSTCFQELWCFGAEPSRSVLFAPGQKVAAAQSVCTRHHGLPLSFMTPKQHANVQMHADLVCSTCLSAISSQFALCNY